MDNDGATLDKTKELQQLVKHILNFTKRIIYRQARPKLKSSPLSQWPVEKPQSRPTLIRMGVHKLDLFGDTCGIKGLKPSGYSRGNIYETDYSAEQLLQWVKLMKIDHPSRSSIVLGSADYSSEKLRELEQYALIYLKKSADFDHITKKEKEQFVTQSVRQLYTGIPPNEHPKQSKTINPLYMDSKACCCSDDEYAKLTKQW